MAKYRTYVMLLSYNVGYCHKILIHSFLSIEIIPTNNYCKLTKLIIVAGLKAKFWQICHNQK